MPSRWPERILCAVDFSPTSAVALRLAGQLAQAASAELTLLHAHSWQAPAYFTEAQIASLEEQIRQAAGDADVALKDFAARECPACVSSRLIIDATPVDAIRQAERKTRADLVVMGTHGRSGLNRFLLGSVAERLLRESALPILTVRQEAFAGPIRTVALTHPTPEAQLAAERLAASFGAELIVLGGSTPDEIPHAGGLLVAGAHRRMLTDSAIQLVRHAPVPVLTVLSSE